jgi:sugar phosphate permease
MNAISGMTDARATRVRYGIVAMLFVVTAVNYADRATISIAGTSLSKELGLDAVTMEFIFSAFGWSYVIGQLPGVVAIMAFAFFGKGLGALGWAVVADTSPKEIAGLSCAMFNMFGNVAAITTPIVIGYIVKATGNFSGALIFVACNALVAIVSYLVIVGEIKRVQLKSA